jgi:hypothetical protein
MRERHVRGGHRRLLGCELLERLLLRHGMHPRSRPGLGRLRQRRGACQQYSYGVVCSGGACTTQLSPDAYLFMQVLSVSVQERNAGGDNWDVLGGLPDPIVSAGTADHGGCTGTCSDTTTCSYSGDDAVSRSGGEPVLFSGAESAQGLPIAVWDGDVDEDDMVGFGPMPVTTLQSSYSTSAFAQVMDVQFRVY